MSAPKINEKHFKSRLKKLYDGWSSHEDLKSHDALVIPMGSSDSPYGKVIALHQWLFDYQLNDSVLLLCKDSMHFLASKKKAQLLEPVQSTQAKDGLPAIILHFRDKTDKDEANFTELVDKIKESAEGKNVGVVKEKLEGEFAPSWNKILEDNQFEINDISTQIACLMAPKDENELGAVKSAASISADVWTKFLRREIINIVDQETTIKHARLAEKTEEKMSDKEVVGSLVKLPLIESSFPPIIQSGGKYTLKFSTTSEKSPVHHSGAIVCSLGARYKNYCSHIARTMLIDPTNDTKETYELLLEAEQAVIDALRPGNTLKQVYEAGMKVIEKAKPALLPKVTKTFGSATGLNFRESSLLIGPKCSEKVEAGMVFVVNMGIGDLKNKNAKDDGGKVIAIMVGDTVLVGQESNEVPTDVAKKNYKKLAILFTSDAEETKKSNNKENIEEEEDMTDFGRGKRSVVLQDQLRKKETNEEKRRNHQKELAQQINEAAKERLAQAKDNVAESKSKKSNVSYKQSTGIPSEKEVESLQIYVDRKHETVILPIFGVPVPFHIAMIKNISSSVEGDFTYLRVNFFCPGSNIGKDNVFIHPLATFVKEMTYRSSNQREPGEISSPSSNLNTAFRIIKEVQKKYKTREAEEKEKEGIVKQDKLIISQNKGNPRLKDLYIRPNIVSKRVAGTLEAHTNGFRYTSLRGDKIDVMYNNIKHAYFQPCDKEMIILLHFHLKHAVLFGKKRHQDVQFYTEVGEITTDLNRYHHMQDRDDLYAEQAEREMRAKLNSAFKSFCEKVDRLTNQGVEFDTPFRELGFVGVPNRSAVTLQPTSGCLVHLTEWPPFVVTLEECELVHFERVSFQLKNFDMVFIYKNYSRKVDMVQQIPMNMLDHVKDWLDSCEIRYTEGVQSLNWPKIMKTIVDDPEHFFSEGGWNFLDGGSDNEEGDGEDDSDEEPEFAPDQEESDESGDEVSDEEDSDAEPTSESGSEPDDAVDSEEESGKDWSDLEEEAAKADRNDDQFERDPRPPPTSSKRPVPKGGRSRGGPPPKRRK